MVPNYPAEKKLWGSKVDEIAFLLGISVDKSTHQTPVTGKVQTKVSYGKSGQDHISVSSHYLNTRF